MRSALLVAGLAGLGRINADAANSLNRRYGLGLVASPSWTKMIDAAAGRGQGGTVLVLAGTGFQTSRSSRCRRLTCIMPSPALSGQDRISPRE